LVAVAVDAPTQAERRAARVVEVAEVGYLTAVLLHNPTQQTADTVLPVEMVGQTGGAVPEVVVLGPPV
jgi:hypothetical protein